MTEVLVDFISKGIIYLLSCNPISMIYWIAKKYVQFSERFLSYPVFFHLDYPIPPVSIIRYHLAVNASQVVIIVFSYCHILIDLMHIVIRKWGDSIQRFFKIILFLLFILLITQGNLAYETTSQALSFWFNRLVPSMFVGMVLSQMCLDYNVFSKIPLLGKLMNFLFNSSSEGNALILSAIFLGAPSGAVLINQKVKDGLLNKYAAKRLITCVSLATPSFIIITCGSVFLNDLKLGFYLWFIEAVICLFFLMIWRKERIDLNLSKTIPSFFTSFRNAVKNSGIALFYIGGYLMMFLTIFNLLTSTACYQTKEILKSFGEFSLGCQSIAASFFPLSLKFPLMALVLGFNGLCVHLQVFSLCENCSLSYPLFLFFRIIQACLGFSLASVLFLLLQ